MRWWIVLCVASLWNTASLQPTKNDRECCPCPKDSDTASSDDVVSMDQLPAGTGARAACPCQLRSADAEGAPSAFLPAAVRAIRPFVSLDDSKEEPKPLLHPEVDLASSVLDTLREATNEEYEEALARDAARVAHEPADIAAESANNLVTVVLNPKDTSYDDAMPEASHAHEARCISPLGRSSLSLRTPAFNSPDLLSEILRLPKKQPPTFRAWNLFDMDSGVGASNVNERVVKPNFESNVDTPEIPTENYKPKSTLSLRVPTLFKNTNSLRNSDDDSILNKLKQSKKVTNKLELSDISKLIPKIDTTHLFRKAGDNDLSLTTKSIDSDSRDSPSTIKLQIPHISSLIPNLDLSSLSKKAEEDTLLNTTGMPDKSRNLANTIKLNVPSILLQKSSNDELNSDIRSSNNLKINVPNIKSTSIDQRASDDMLDSDSSNAASNLQERYSSLPKVNTADCNDLQSKTIEISNDYKTPAAKYINMKNIENIDFKDSTPKKKIGLNLKVPDLKLAPSKSRDAATDLLNNIFKEIPHIGNLISSDIFNLRNNDMATKSTEKKVDEIVQNNPFSTEIIDTVPSPSEPQISNVNIVEKERDDDITNKINEEIQNMIEEMPVKTEIIDSLPKSSELSDINDSEDSEEEKINEVKVENNDLTNTVNQQTEKSLANDEQTSELANEIEEMNEDSIDDIIDETNNGMMDRDNHAENAMEDIDTVRSSLDLIEKDEFVNENKIDGLAVNSDIQSLSEKSSPETSFTNNKNVLQPLREKFRQRLASLKLAPKITAEFPRLSGTPKSSKDPAQSESRTEDTTKNDVDSKESKENADQVGIDDLQKMSDSLLIQEKKHKDLVLAESAKSEVSNTETNMNDDVQPAEAEVQETNNIDTLKKVDNACIVNELSNKNADLEIASDSKNNEMTVGASERVASIADPDFNLASPLRQSIVLEPISFGSGLNLFNSPPSLDLSNLVNNRLPLPGFKIPSLLKASEDMNSKLFSTNDDSSEDDFKPNGLSAQPSTARFRSSLPPLQPLEDINLDILQLKPLSVDMPSLPRLNLNSFKTKLALPKSLDLKPVLLESSMGNKKGVIGATLTLGSGKDFDRSNLLQQASSSLRSSNILRQSLGALPSLDDLHEDLREKTQNLLSTPLETTGRNVVEDTLRSSQVLTDNLRVEAENTLKDIHENLASTFRGAGLPVHSSLGSFKSSGDILEELTRRHEDVNDKLKGISVDLSDRLESFRDNLLDQYRIPTLGSSFLGQSSLFGSAIPKQSSTVRTYKKPSQNTLKFSSKGKFVNPATKRKSTPRTSNNKLKTASSIVAPKAIEIPKLRTAPTETNVLKALRKESNLKTPQFLSRDRTLGLLQPEKNLIDLDRPLIKKPRLGQSKVKISFSTTPFPPAFRSKSSFGADSKLKAKSLKDSLATLPRSVTKDKKGLGSKLSSFRDSSGFASEAIPSRVKAPIRKPSSLRTSLDSDMVLISATTPKPVLTLSLTKPKSSLAKIPSSDIDRPTTFLKSKSLVPVEAEPKAESLPLSSGISQIPALSWPKKLDEDFLTKVREALRARLAEIGKKSAKPITESKLGNLEPTDDMARSASNNIDVIDPEIMKENTSYTCKMMCTKNT